MFAVSLAGHRTSTIEKANKNFRCQCPLNYLFNKRQVRSTLKKAIKVVIVEIQRPRFEIPNFQLRTTLLQSEQHDALPSPDASYLRTGRRQFG